MVNGVVKKRQYLGDGLWSFLCCQEIVSLYSLRPIGQIALDMELCYVCRALHILETIEMPLQPGFVKNNK